ncbi:hypothetical protein V6N12_036633 [Hibiscus sabdariffa]|uniref:Uncharacterized protein n=1 Tax=Hibiscus sabdariffa TaxID=183260 RepID=A0ABR2ER51_9ROSI
MGIHVAQYDALDDNTGARQGNQQAEGAEPDDLTICQQNLATENASEHEPAGANIEVQDSFDGVSESNLSTDLSTPVVDSGVEEQPTHIEMSTHIPLADYVFESNCADNNGGEQEPETSLHASSTKKYRK